MSGIMSLRWESLRSEDVGAWAALVDAAEIVDKTGERYDAGDLAEQLGDSLVDVEGGTRAVWDGDVLVAVGLLRCGPSGDPSHRMFFEGVAHPAYRRRGVGRELTRWALQTAPRLSEARYPGRPVELHVDVSERNPGKAALFEHEGYTPQRWFFVMRRDLADDVPDVAIPEGIRVTGFDFAYDAEARDVRNESFADNWGSARQTEESWRQGYTGTRSFRPDLSFLAIADAQVAAILLTHYFEADTVATGHREAWISTIGTLRAWRKRGVAGALMRATLTEAKTQGFSRVMLVVDTDNPTGALSLYRAAGFVEEHKHSRYVREF
ncbi:GNAT family N-acetyltransferase [Acrocarpospora corrugata]|uniref:GNAT family N-acetyltransferase n=1 Tax=Acrocarpospora corrugata TaxID=35763 RepID=UPI0014794736|nr:GNAT family N-acetyltransferase [Acrocarpospora corrugata]